MQAAHLQMAAHAHNIANVSTEGHGTDLVEDVVGLVVASHMYSANAKVLAVMAETERALLDVRA
jgi:flagellar hook protein FlgE